MTKRKPTVFEIALEEQIRRLRLQNQELREQVRQERRRADQHADELAFERQMNHTRAQRNSWGMH